MEAHTGENSHTHGHTGGEDHEDDGCDDDGDDDDDDDYVEDYDHYTGDDNDLYIIGRFCVCVTKNEHFAQRSQINFYFYFQVGFHSFSWFQVGLSWFQVCFHGFSWFQVGFTWYFMVQCCIFMGFHGFS